MDKSFKIGLFAFLATIGILALPPLAGARPFDTGTPIEQQREAHPLSPAS